MKTLYCALIILMAPRPIVAQTDSLETPVVNHFRTSELRCLQFTLINDVSAAYVWKAFGSIPLRAKLDISLDVEHRLVRQSAGSPPNDYTIIRKTSSEGASIDISAQYYYVFEHQHVVTFHLATGPILSYSFSHWKNENSTEPPVSQQTTSSDFADNFVSFGVITSIGLECPIYRNISALMEYHLTGSYGRYLYDRSSSSPTFDGRWRLTLSKMTIGLGVYL